MRHIESLVEAYLTAERDLFAAADAASGAVPLPDGRIVTVGRAEFDSLLGERHMQKKKGQLARPNLACPHLALGAPARPPRPCVDRAPKRSPDPRGSPIVLSAA
jgi:hypothetical protein